MTHLGGPRRHAGSPGPRRQLQLQSEGGIDGWLPKRDSRWEGEGGLTLAVWQERSLFGNSVQARLSGGTPEQVDAVRDTLAEVGVELVVEP